MRLSVSIPDELARRVDDERGDLSRSAFVRRALEWATFWRRMPGEERRQQCQDDEL